MAPSSRSARILGPRKTVEDALAVTERPGSRLKRDLGRLDIMIVGIGVMVGAGIFVLTGQAAATEAGPAVWRAIGCCRARSGGPTTATARPAG
jgi:amino acid permease